MPKREGESKDPERDHQRAHDMLEMLAVSVADAEKNREGEHRFVDLKRESAITEGSSQAEMLNFDVGMMKDDMQFLTVEEQKIAKDLIIRAELYLAAEKVEK